MVARNSSGIVNRNFLFLQGPSSWFFNKLAKELRIRGGVVKRVSFCPGDCLYWRGSTIAFQLPKEMWSDFFADTMRQQKITDVVCLGDGRFWHKVAIERIRSCFPETRVNIVEHGYLRPDWLTIEPDGTGGRSRFPTAFETEVVKSTAKQWLPETGYRTSFLKYAGLDIGYHLANVMFGWVSYPNYKTHSIHTPHQEWAGWIKKAVMLPLRKRELRKNMLLLRHQEGPLFIFPLQLETDYQIRQHGTDDGLRSALNNVVATFARHAPTNAALIVKVHPLDNGLTPWRTLVFQAAKTNGCLGRCFFLDGGDLNELVNGAAGLVTVNSTVGLTALLGGIPVKVLGKAIYDLPRLTDQRPLENFWQRPEIPNSAHVTAFVDMLKSTIQVPGGFDGQGAAEGARNIADKLMQPQAF